MGEMADWRLCCAERASSGVGCSRNSRVSAVARSRSSREGGYALVPSPMARPQITGSIPDLNIATQMATATPIEIGVRPHGAKRSAHQHPEERDGDSQRRHRDVARVHGGDHHERREIVDHGQGEQEHADAGRRPGGDQRHRGEGERGVGRHRGSPPVPTGAPGVEGQVDQDRQRHPGHRREHRDGKPAPLAQLAEVKLALGLEAHDEEEQRHQPLVDPGAQIGGDFHAPHANRELARPHLLVGVPSRRVRPQQRSDRCPQHHERATGLGAQEAPDRRGEVPCPRSPTAERGHLSADAHRAATRPAADRGGSS